MKRLFRKASSFFKGDYGQQRMAHFPAQHSTPCANACARRPHTHDAFTAPLSDADGSRVQKGNRRYGRRTDLVAVNQVARVDAEALPERLRRLHQQLGAVFDDAADVVRQPQLAYEMYFSLASRMMSAASSTLLSGNLSRKILFPSGKHCFAGRKAPFREVGSDVLQRGRSHTIARARRAAATCLSAQGCACRFREDGCMKSMRETSAYRQIQGELSNYKLQITDYS